MSPSLRFLDLPVELRFMVYDRLTSLPPSRRSIGTSNIINDNAGRNSTVAAVSATCQQLSGDVHKYLSLRRLFIVTISEPALHWTSSEFVFAAFHCPIYDFLTLFKQIQHLQLIVKSRGAAEDSGDFVCMIEEILDTLEASENLMEFDFQILSCNGVVEGNLNMHMMRLKMKASKGRREQGESDKDRELQYARKALALMREAVVASKGRR